MWNIIGQEKIVSLLQRGLEKGTLSHAYLLVGPAHVGKMTLTLNLAQALNCDSPQAPCGECVSCQKTASGKHADVQVIRLIPGEDSAEGKLRTEIGIDQIEDMQHSASLPPFEGRNKVFIIDGAERLSMEAANRLLKTLEEPTGRVTFILLALSESRLPSTVVSRCQRLELRPLGIKEAESALITRWKVEPQKARLLARLCRGCLGWALSANNDGNLLQQRDERLEKLVEVIDGDYNERFAYAAQLATQFSHSRAEVQEVMDLWMLWWRDLLLVKSQCEGDITNIDFANVFARRAAGYSLAQLKAVIDGIQAARNQLEKNVNARLVLEVLMLNIPKKGDAVSNVTVLSHG
ncbi:MAG: DNA polymerase III subunit delta' [Chloroflexi bacterium]|nr:DNA polymerase III subunit delta' [Chloroflexota bacterium]